MEEEEQTKQLSSQTAPTAAPAPLGEPVPAVAAPALEQSATAAPAPETTAAPTVPQLSSGAVTAVAPPSGFRIEVIAHGVRIIHDPSAPTNENNTTKYDDVSPPSSYSPPLSIFLLRLFYFLVLSLSLPLSPPSSTPLASLSR